MRSHAPGVWAQRRESDRPDGSSDAVDFCRHYGFGPSPVDVNLLVQLPSHLQEWVESYRDAELVENIARSEATLARSRGAAALLDARLTMHETAVVLGVPHQRIKQLADRAPDTPQADLRESIITAIDVSRRERKGGRPAGAAVS